MSRDREGAVVRARGVVAAVGSREDAKTRRSVFGFRSGESRTGVRGCGVSVARAFQPEICPSAIDLRTGAVELQTVCFTRSREGKRRGLLWVCVCELPALLSTFSHLLSMAWMPWPPHPRPLSPVSRGRGEDFVFW